MTWTRTPGTLRIATWNLERPRRGGSQRIPKLLERIRAQTADLWVLTETNDVIHLSDTHVAVVSSPPAAYHTPGENWTTIWVRKCFPFRRLHTSDSSRTVCAEIELPGAPMILYGTVLPWNGDGGNGWEEQYRVIRQQGEEWVRLSAAIPGCRLCVAGDLNMSLDEHRWDGRKYYGTEEGRKLLTTTLADAKMKCVTDDDYFKIGKLKTQSTIDHVCLDATSTGSVRHVGVWEAEDGDGGRLSDHNGVFVDLEV